MEESVFSKIIKGDIPCYKVSETENCFAFLDIAPLAKGHTLVIPKKQIDYIFDVEDPLYIELMLFAKKVAKGIKAVNGCPKVGMAVVGLEVPHAHVHLVPIHQVKDLDFSRPKLSFSKEEFEKIAADIAAAMQ